MRLQDFDYYLPNNLEEAISIFSNEDSSKLLGGGTDLLIKMKKGIVKPVAVIDLKGLKNILNFISYEKDKNCIIIGATTSLQDIAKSPIITKYLPVLAEAAISVGSLQIRNKGTIGGNICNASPAADTAPALLAYGAEVVMYGSNGKRSIPLSKFFVGPEKTTMGEKEILTEIIVPVANESNGTYIKLASRKAMDISIASIAIIVFSSPSEVKEIQIALGSVAPTAVLVKGIQVIYDGSEPLNSKTIKKIGKLSVEQISPITDHRASAAYRSEMVFNLVCRVVGELTLAGGKKYEERN